MTGLVAIKDEFLDDDHPEPIRAAVDDCCTYAAAGRLASDDDSVDTEAEARYPTNGVPQNALAAAFTITASLGSGATSATIGPYRSDRAQPLVNQGETLLKTS